MIIDDVHLRVGISMAMLIWKIQIFAEYFEGALVLRNIMFWLRLFVYMKELENIIGGKYFDEFRFCSLITDQAPRETLDVSFGRWWVVER